MTQCGCGMVVADEAQVHNTHIGTAKSTKKLRAATPESGR